MKALRLIWHLIKWGASSVGHLALWTVWLVLSTALVVQIVIACSHELKIPSLIVKSFEDRLALAGLHAMFDTASFDPSGHVLIENLRLSSDRFEEPLVVCQSLFVKLDVLSLLIGSIEPESIRGRGLTFYVPSMFSPSGRSEPVLGDLGISLRPADKEFYIEELVGRAGALAVTCHGSLRLFHSRRGTPRDSREIVSAAVDRYIRSARQLVLWQAKLTAFEDPMLTVVLTPDEYHMARAAVTFSTRSADLTQETLGQPSFKQAIRVSKLRVQTSLPLILAPQARVQALATAEAIQIGDGTEVTNPAVRLTGILRAEPLGFETRELVSSLGRVTTRGIDLPHISVALEPQAWPQLTADLSGLVADQPWSVQVDGNPLLGAGHVSAKGKISSALLSLVGKKIGRNLNELLVLEAPATLVADARFEEGWKLATARGHGEVGKVLARGVSIDHASADLSFSGTALRVTDVLLAQGENLARGSYTMDTKSLAYRFLLTGHLRPVDISGWFHDWWPRFWSSFDFSAAAPEADVEVQGRWREPYLTTVMIFADCVNPIVRSVPFDRVRTTLFIRPDFYDGIEFLVTRGSGQARGRFTRSVDLEQHDFRWMDFQADSTLEIQETARLFGPVGVDLVEPFRFGKPPALALSGRLDGEASPNGVHQKVNIDVASTGSFNFFGFPVADLNCHATVQDRDIAVTGLRVHFAEGEARGTAHVSGRGDERQLTFDATLHGASLGQAIRTLEEFGAKRRGEKPPEVSRFQQRIATGKLDLNASANGLYKNPYSFVGSGTAELRGTEFAEINLLGGLSEAVRGNSLLGFTSWRLDTAQTSFSIEREKLVLPDLHITGPTAKLDAHGSYALDSKAISFNAKFYPYEQGKTLLASAVGFVLTPVSAALELRLAGTLDQPKWYFAYGPTSLFRKLAGSEEKTEPEPAPKPASAPPLLLRP